MPCVGHANKAAGDSTVVYGPLVTEMEVLPGLHAGVGGVWDLRTRLELTHLSGTVVGRTLHFAALGSITASALPLLIARPLSNPDHCPYK
jgi:hypothetical protein